MLVSVKVIFSELNDPVRVYLCFVYDRQKKHFLHFVFAAWVTNGTEQKRKRSNCTNILWIFFAGKTKWKVMWGCSIAHTANHTPLIHLTCVRACERLRWSLIESQLWIILMITNDSIDYFLFASLRMPIFGDNAIKVEIRCKCLWWNSIVDGTKKNCFNAKIVFRILSRRLILFSCTNLLNFVWLSISVQWAH